MAEPDDDVEPSSGVGSDRGNELGRKRAPEHVAAMRHVVKCPKEQDGVEHYEFRKMFEADPFRFMAFLQKCEMEARALNLKAQVELGPKLVGKGRKDRQAGEVPEDGGEEKVRALAERFLESVKRKFG